MGCGSLLEKGANVHAQDKHGETALMYAIFNHNKCAEMILKNKPNLDVKNYSDETTLDVARTIGNEEMIEILEKQMRWDGREKFLKIYRGRNKKEAAIYQIKM